MFYREPAKHSPFYAACHVGGAVISIGEEDTNVIRVSVQFTDSNLQNISSRGHVRAYLASSATTLAPATSLPSSIVAGTHGVVKGSVLKGLTALTDSTTGTANNTLEAIPAAALTLADADIDDTPSHTNVETAIKDSIDAVSGPIKNCLADLAAKVNEIIAAANEFHLISTDAGLVDIDITKSGAATYYLVLQLPDGSVVVSDAITFAA